MQELLLITQLHDISRSKQINHKHIWAVKVFLPLETVALNPMLSLLCLSVNGDTNSIHMWHLARIEPWPLVAMVGGEQSHDYAIPAPAECVCWLYFAVAFAYQKIFTFRFQNTARFLLIMLIFSLKNLISLYLIKSLDVVGNTKKDWHHWP